MSQPNPIRSWTRSHLPCLLVPLALAVAGVLLVGCGGSTPASNAADKEQASERKAEAQLADFAKCMREHGIEAKAATGPGGQGHGLEIHSGAGPAKVEAAQKACKRYQPQARKVNLSPQQKVAQQEAVQKFARCMREHGIKVEASTEGGGISIRIHAHPGAEGAPNPESPAFQKSQNTCQKLLPGGGPGGRTADKSPGGGAGSESGASLSTGD